jgi:hypothetical protein
MGPIPFASAAPGSARLSHGEPEEAIMRGTISILVVSACAVVVAPATSRNAEQIDKLIAQLGSSNFRQREAATKELEAIGEPALAAVKNATTDGDMEVANRATALLERITKRLDNARLLEPTYVNLKFKDTPVEEAIAELAKQSGYPITIEGEKYKLAERRITLETARVPFWVAFEKLREQSGLTQAENRQPGLPPPGDPQFNRVPAAVLAESARVQARQSAAPNLVLVDGAAKPLPTHVEGAVRIRSTASMPNSPSAKPNELNGWLQVQAEPRLGMERIIGVKITKAIDNEGQSLDPVLAEPIDGTGSAADVTRVEVIRRRELLMAQRFGSSRTMAVAHQGVVPVRFGKGHKESTELRELEGSVTLAVRSRAEDLAVIENPLKAKAGTSARGKGDVQLTLVSMKRLDNGEYEVQFDVQYSYDVFPAAPQRDPPGAAPRLEFGAQVPAQAQLQALQFQAQFNGPAGPASVANTLGVILVDDKDQPYRTLLKDVSSRNRGMIRWYAASVIFRPGDKKHGEPVKLAFRGTRPMQVEVPFVLKDVPLK